MIIPYIGGKSKFRNFIIPHIPSDISTFVEPFGGMMGIYFSLNLDNYKNVKFVYNDINYFNYNLFNKLKDHNFINLVKSTKVDVNFYNKILDEIYSSIDDTKKALYWLIILTCSDPYSIGKSSWRSSNEFDIFKIKYLSYKDSIDSISNIHNDDYKTIISMYDSTSTFFYIDPPYKGREDYYINHNFNSKSHYELSEVLNGIEGRFILSYYNFDGLTDLYKGCNIEVKRSIMGNEYIIMNY